MKVTFEYQPLVEQEAALFTTPEGTEYQVMWGAWSGDIIRFGVRVTGGGDWHYGTFRYADGWRERNGWPKWDRATFRRMVNDFVAEGTD